ncbi:MAG: sn-glycerol-3-phosphate ABC transporter substrate-binding protein [Betaproteobacteria bacterium RIFCSPLOWO2_12_FULL_63_13]|nr:MAG: sn-glycerol-3-phosphate ABC transporter substrate-binding protein [Betaproteobacteria bacterium RIFCSPLOWO2_12_FULL_63_13]
MKCQALAYATAILLTMHAPYASSITEIQFWHAMSGTAGEQVAELASRFNASQPGYRIVPVYKGGYEDAFAAGIAALRTRTAPHIIQVFDAGTATMLTTQRALKPLYRLMAEAGEKLDARAYIPAVSSSYADSRGRLLSLPFNSSTAVFFYNKDLFRKARIDPAVAPKTWRDVQVVAEKIRDSDAAPCAYTTDWQSWILVENLSAWHNEPLATRDNGFGGAGAKLNFNGELLIRHIGLMSSWIKSGLFTYAGRANEGEAKFASGECAMITASSAAYPAFAKSARFAFAVSRLPYYEEFRNAPYNTIVRGASLWVPAGKKKSEYKGIAKFFNFLTRPEIQADWDRQTGYLPNTLAAYALIRTQGYYERNPGADIAVEQVSRKLRAHSRGVRLVNFPRIRAVIDEELEAVWSQAKTPKEALDSAVARGNELLRRFERSGQG